MGQGIHAKKQRPEESTSYDSDQGGDNDQQFSFQFRDTKISLSKQNVALSGLTLLGLSAFLGPLIFGILFTSISIVLASLGGALALSTMFIPILIFSVVFVLVPFGSVAFFGLSIIAPTFLQLFLTGSAMALGWWAMNKILVIPGQSTKGTMVSKEVPKVDPVEVPKTKSYEEKEMERVQAELRDFDELLKMRERQIRGVDRS